MKLDINTCLCTIYLKMISLFLAGHDPKEAASPQSWCRPGTTKLAGVGGMEEPVAQSWLYKWNVCMYGWMDVRMYVCTYVRMYYVCIMYVYMYVYM